MRNLVLLLGITAVGCAPEQVDVEAANSVSYTYAGELPADVDIDALVEEVPAGSFALVGNAETGEVAIVQVDGSPNMRIASSEFSLATNPICTNCGGACTNNSSTRTLSFDLTHSASGDPTGTETYNFSTSTTKPPRNFTFLPPATLSGSPAVDFTHPTGSTQTYEFTGTIGDCSRSFSYVFDVSTTSRGVFVSSSTTAGNFGGHAGADAICQSDADAARLGGTWKAWLSTSTVSAAAHLDHSSKSYRRVDGQVIATNWADLITPPLGVPIGLDSNGMTISQGPIWTGTTSNGTAFGGNCVDWTSSLNTDVGRAGDPTKVVGTWTVRHDRPCDITTGRLFCFEQGL